MTVKGGPGPLVPVALILVQVHRVHRSRCQNRVKAPGSAVREGCWSALFFVVSFQGLAHRNSVFVEWINKWKPQIGWKLVIIRYGLLFYILGRGMDPFGIWWKLRNLFREKQHTLIGLHKILQILSGCSLISKAHSCHPTSHSSETHCAPHLIFV